MVQEISLPFDLDLSPVKILRAGEITCTYESGNLRYIRSGNTELLRKIYGAIRNEYWETMPYEIIDEKINVTRSGFTVSYTAIYYQHSAIYRADFLIEGNADNSLTFSMKGEALAAFQKNRIGLCILHPINEGHGLNAMVTRPDGTTYQSEFPELVKPTQLFFQVRQMQWETNDKKIVQLIFDGDVFETEDQRNWSDSSYKTYSTPLDIPIPAMVAPGDTIEQVVTVKISGASNNDSAIIPQDLIREEKLPFPKIGYCKSKNQAPLGSHAIDWLGKIPFDHYRVIIEMNERNWKQEVNMALRDAEQINTSLELIVFFTRAFEGEIVLLINELKENPQLVRSILVLHHNYRASPPGLLHYIYPILKKELPGTRVGFGTDFFFADINRNRPGQTPCDFISFGLQPQAHVFDNRSLLENLESQADIVETATGFAYGKQVCISPIALKDRLRPDPESLIPPHNKVTIPDDRQYSWLIAFWTLISIQNFSAAFSITFYELFGASGILLPVYDQDNEIAGFKPSPVYKVFATIHHFKPAWVIKRFSGQKMLLDGLMLENENGERLFFKAPPEIVAYKHEATSAETGQAF